MDELGYYTACKEDWDQLALEIKERPVTFAYSHDQITSYIVSFCQTKRIGGPLPWGGGIDGMHLVGVRRFGHEFFDLESSAWFSPEYIAEKLNLSPGGSDSIAVLLSEIRDRLRKSEEGG